jgi:hypothetical protein
LETLNSAATSKSSSHLTSNLTTEATMAEPLQEEVIASDNSDSPVDASAESPPPEKANAIWTRRIIIFAFWAVVATLGLPHWIWTTSIYRSELPMEQMTQWAEGQVGVFVDVPVCC